VDKVFHFADNILRCRHVRQNDPRCASVCVRFQLGYDLISDDALDQLATRYPEYNDQIEQAGNAAPTKDLLLQQLADVLPNDAKRSEILAVYSVLVDKLAQQKSAGTRPDDANALARLSAFGIQFWNTGVLR
jgi:hypothetical protein